MKDILNYSTFDDTNEALRIWNLTDPLEQAQHKLSNSREYRVYAQALVNEANIAAYHASLASK